MKFDTDTLKGVSSIQDSSVYLDDFGKCIFDAVLQVKREFRVLPVHLHHVAVQEFRGFVEQVLGDEDSHVKDVI